MLQHLAKGAWTSCSTRQHRPGVPVVRQGHPQRAPARPGELRIRCTACTRMSSTGATSALRCGASPRRRARSMTSRLQVRLDPYLEIAEQAARLRRRLLRESHLLASRALQAAHRLLSRALRVPRASHREAGDRRAADRPSSRRTRRMLDPLPSLLPMPRRSTPDRAWRMSSDRPCSRSAVPRRSSTRRSPSRSFGDYQRQMFLMDHAGLLLRRGTRADRTARQRGHPRAAERARLLAATGSSRDAIACIHGHAKYGESEPRQLATEPEPGRQRHRRIPYQDTPVRSGAVAGLN